MAIRCSGLLRHHACRCSLTGRRRRGARRGVAVRRPKGLPYASLRVPCAARRSGQVRQHGHEYRASKTSDLAHKRADPDRLRCSAAPQRAAARPPRAERGCGGALRGTSNAPLISWTGMSRRPAEIVDSRCAAFAPLGAVGLQGPNAGNGDKGSVEHRIAKVHSTRIAIIRAVAGEAPTRTYAVDRLHRAVDQSVSHLRN